MITQAKINEWIRQVEAAPVVAPILIRQITDRLLELDHENEDLRAKNLELSTGNKVRQFEKKIAELEFQLDLLKRQSTGGDFQVAHTSRSLLVYNDRGQLLRLQLEETELVQGQTFAHIEGTPDLQSYSSGLLAVNDYDQLLLIFSTGRTSILSIEELPPGMPDTLDWAGAYQIELRSLEELIWILPVTRMHAYDYCVQVSRFGYARKISNQYLNTFIANNNIGKGVKFNFDRILNLVFCNDNQLLVLVSKAGNCLGIDTRALSVTLDEIMRFKVNDYIAAASIFAPGEMLIGITQNGRVYFQNQSWISSGKNGEQKVRRLFPAKKEAEIVAGAVTANSADWLLVLNDAGCLSAFKPGNFIRQGELISTDSDARIVSLAALPPATLSKNEA